MFRSHPTFSSTSLTSYPSSSSAPRRPARRGARNLPGSSLARFSEASDPGRRRARGLDFITVPRVLQPELSATDSILIAMEGGGMDQVCMAAMTNQPSLSDNKLMKNISGEMPATATAGSGSFDCNICLDFAADPVVTLCGHLYCWPCIYEWLRPSVVSASSDNTTSARQQCPVCKAALSADSLVPLYGRCGSSKKSMDGTAIPRRPTVHRENVVHQHTQSSFDDRHHQNMEPSPPLRPLRHAHHHHPGATEFDFVYPPSPLGRGLIHSTAGGVLGGMAEAVLPWAFRGQVPPSMYYTSPYAVADHTVGPRLRRQQMEVERSLHQIWFFLFVFVVLCLLLF